MKIVVLDGYTTNPGDLSWEPLEELGELTVYQRTEKEDIIRRAEDAQIVLTNDVPLTEETLKMLPELQYICVLATGYDRIDLNQAKKQHIIVSNSPGYSTYSVSQTAIAHLLHLTQHVKDHADAVREGQWERSEDVCFWNYPMVELKGKTMGIIGMGAIGRQTAAVAEALGMQIRAYSPRPRPVEGLETLEWVPLNELFSRSDVLTLHAPLTSETRNLVTREQLQRMKPTAFLINTSRGGLIVEEDLVWALKNNIIAGAALDVLQKEPPAAGHPLMDAENCFITPHNAWATKEARNRLMGIAAANIRAFMDGSPVHVVS